MTHLSPQQLSAHLDCALHGASLQTVEGHLESCERCRDELAALTLQDQMLTEALRGETDRELFDLIGLRVQSVVHPQRARALEKSIGELERARDERRRHAESLARRVTEERQQSPGEGEPARDRAEGPAMAEAGASPVAHESPGGAEPDAHVSPAAELRRRALEEARARAEAEARAFALEGERAREEAEQQVLEQAATRARREAAARRRAEEAGRTRAASSARAEAERLAREAEAALAEAETSARDALAARARAETRAAAAEEARRQARQKADEARLLEAQLADQADRATRAARVAAPPEPATRAAESFLQLSPEPATLSAEEVAAVREWSEEDGVDALAPRPPRSRRFTPPPREPARSRYSTALTLAASVVILLAAFWFAIGRQLVNAPGEPVPTRTAIEPEASGDASAPAEPSAAAAPETDAPTPAPVVAEDAHRSHHAAAPEPSRRGEPGAAEAASAGTGQATVIEESQSSTIAEPDDETPVDLGLLCGTVRDEDHHPIAGARVMMADVGVVVVTDRVGRFCLTAPRGARTLSVIALGFGTHRETVSVGRRTSELSVTLRTSSPTPRPPSR